MNIYGNKSEGGLGSTSSKLSSNKRRCEIFFPTKEDVFFIENISPNENFFNRASLYGFLNSSETNFYGVRIDTGFSNYLIGLFNTYLQ